MLHLLYLVAFTAIAFLAIANLLRSLFTLTVDSQRRYSPPAHRLESVTSHGFS
jgi:hypothetical protein